MRFDSRTVRSAVAGLFAIVALTGWQVSQDEQMAIMDWAEKTVAVVTLAGAWYYRVNRRVE